MEDYRKQCPVSLLLEQLLCNINSKAIFALLVISEDILDVILGDLSIVHISVWVFVLVPEWAE